jgi:hypothetical protein
MKIREYVTHLAKDFVSVYGCLMVIVSIYLGIYSTETIKSSLIWQVLLAASAYTLLKNAFVNKYELEQKFQLMNFALCSTLGDLMVVLWLIFFSPGRLNDINLAIAYIVVILIVKAAVYTMMRIDGKKQAKQLNDKLSQYNKGNN